MIISRMHFLLSTFALFFFFDNRNLVFLKNKLLLRWAQTFYTHTHTHVNHMFLILVSLFYFNISRGKERERGKRKWDSNNFVVLASETTTSSASSRSLWNKHESNNKSLSSVAHIFMSLSSMLSTLTLSIN